MAISRRQTLKGIAAALFIAQGCAVFRGQSELDAALADLESLLDEGGSGDADTLVASVSEIGELSRSMIEGQNEFSREFNLLAANRETNDATLNQLVAQYDQNRLALRNQLLTIQDELQAEVPEELWPDVLEILNRKWRSMVPERVRGA